MMKYLGLMLVAFAVLVAADEKRKPTDDDYEDDKKLRIQITQDCIKETGITEEQTKREYPRKTVPKEKEILEFFLCKVKKMGIFTEDKGLNFDRMKAFWNDWTLTAADEQVLITKCVDSNEQKSTPAEWAYRVINCIERTRSNQMLAAWIVKYEKAVDESYKVEREKKSR